MGIIHTSSDSAWNRLVRAFAQKKIDLRLDGVTMCPNPAIDEPINALVAWVDSVPPTATMVYPSNWDTKSHILRRTFFTFLADTFCEEFAELFRGKSFEELDELASSFSFESCVHRDELTRVLRENVRS